MNQEKENYKIQQWILFLSIVLFVIKILAWYLTLSVSILSDALESIVNVIAGFIGLYSLYVAAKPKDLDHPYGHGKAEFISAAAEGAMIFVAGIFIIYHAVLSLRMGSTVHQLDTGLWLVSITAVVNYAFGAFCIKKGRKNNSLALEASGKHLQIDTYSTLTIVIGLVIIRLTSLHWIDAALAIGLGFFIIWNGYRILRSSIAGIMDEADISLVKKIIEVMNENRRPNWIDVHNLKVQKFGANLHIDCHMTVPYYLTVQQAHDEMSILQNIVREQFTDNIEFNVHFDPCRDWSCEICTKEDCPVRKHPFVKQIPWILSTVLGPKQQQLKESAVKK